VAGLFSRQTEYDSDRDVPNRRDGHSNRFYDFACLGIAALRIGVGGCGGVLGMVAGECAGLLVFGGNSYAIARRDHRAQIGFGWPREELCAGTSEYGHPGDRQQDDRFSILLAGIDSDGKELDDRRRRSRRSDRPIRRVARHGHSSPAASRRADLFFSGLARSFIIRSGI